MQGSEMSQEKYLRTKASSLRLLDVEAEQIDAAVAGNLERDPLSVSGAACAGHARAQPAYETNDLPFLRSAVTL